eukprot:TRINITY_DN6314_c0_g3_i3.p1 TRINITY_DN6314_c0_g3~~TRINITY_DN6314_c0_g3_i3.p1  ORF type:complete len:305 (-),score=30.29 TRINITY_DN6314_c0_g3_i3:96-1010(-)
MPRLPRNPKQFASLVRRCFPQVFDTAHLHGAIGGFRRLGLTKFLEDAKDSYAKRSASGRGIPHVSFALAPETAERYGDSCGDSDDCHALAHEAGYDSLLTAQLFAYLKAMSSGEVVANANRLFLYKSAECLDLDLAGAEGRISCNAYDESRVSLHVATLTVPDDFDTARTISRAGGEYKWIDASQLFVVVRPQPGRSNRGSQQAKTDDHVSGNVDRVMSRAGNAVRKWERFAEWQSARQRPVSTNDSAVRTPVSSKGSLALLCLFALFVTARLPSLRKQFQTCCNLMKLTWSRVVRKTNATLKR